MKCIKKIEESYILVMNREEAEWLKSIMQNPLHGDPNDEDDIGQLMRHSIFESINNTIGITTR